jgi:hypothetical protein
MACRTCPQPFQGNNMARNNPIQSQTFQKFTPGQQGLQQQAIGGAQSILNNLMNPSAAIGPVAELNKRFGDQAQKDFLGRTVPGIAEQFTGLQPGSQRSSGFTQSLGRSGADLNEKIQSNLGQLFSQLRGQDIATLGSLLNAGLQPSFESLTFPKQPTFGQRLGQGAAQAVGPALNLAGNLATGGWWGIGKGLADLFAKFTGNRNIDQNQEDSPAQQLNEQQLQQILSYLTSVSGGQ